MLVVNSSILYEDNNLKGVRKDPREGKGVGLEMLMNECVRSGRINVNDYVLKQIEFFFTTAFWETFLLVAHKVTSLKYKKNSLFGREGVPISLSLYTI